MLILVLEILRGFQQDLVLNTSLDRDPISLSMQMDLAIWEGMHRIGSSMHKNWGYLQERRLKKVLLRSIVKDMEEERLDMLPM